MRSSFVKTISFSFSMEKILMFLKLQSYMRPMGLITNMK